MFNKEIHKHHITRDVINRYVCMLYDIWGKDIAKIYTKLMVVIEGRFTYDNEDLKYIRYEINKILN